MFGRYRTITAAMTIVTLAGCAPKPAPVARSIDDALVLVTRGADILGVKPARGDVVFEAPFGLLSPDRTRLITARHVGRETLLRELDPTSGSERWSTRLRGSLEPRAVSRSGIVALQTAARVGDLVIADRNGERQRIGVTRTFEPEAFTDDERTLVVVDYLTERGADRYRLQELDLATGRLSRLGARIKQLAPEEMQGAGRTARWAPDGSRLFTLFTRQPAAGHDDGPAGHVTAFVHVLDTRGWAHCVDLPVGFGVTGNAATLAVAPDGAVYAVDAYAGIVAVIDAQTLRVSRVEDVATLRGGGVTAAASADTLAVARGGTVRLFDTAQMSVRAEMDAPRDMNGLGAGEDGTFFAIAAERIVTLEPGGSIVRSGSQIPGARSIALVSS